jgi:HD-like signal output (HDOD) protein
VIFKGDLSNFRPSDLFAFLANLEVQGLLTVMDQGDMIRVGFKEGAIISSQCKQVDEKILRLLYSRQIIDKAKFTDIRQIQNETNLSVREILENMKLGHLIRHKTIFEFGVYETVFHCFLMESGQYHFADIVVDPDVPDLKIDYRQLMHEITRWVDEWHEILRDIGPLDRTVVVGSGLGPEEKQTALINGILDMASRRPSMRHIVSMLPGSNLRSLKQIEQLVKRGVLEIEKLADSTMKSHVIQISDNLFSEFKKTVKQIIFAQDIKFRLSALAGFCRQFFNGMLIFTVKEGRVIQYAALSQTGLKTLQQTAAGSLNIPLTDDRVFQVVTESNTAFFGKPFFSPLLDAVSSLSGTESLKENGAEECAVIPILGAKTSAVLLYAHGTPSGSGSGPFNYLEILSWLFRLEKGSSSPVSFGEAQAVLWLESKKAEVPNEAIQAPSSASGDRKRIAFSMDVVDTLPPMSHMISQILRVLSDPDSSISELAELVSMDPSLVAQLIKVSNSALYKGLQEITSLKRALSRLGNKTVRSIVMISATKDLFPSGNVKVGKLGQSLWRHSVECGLASRRVAIQTGYHDPEAAFTAGVLHDIGKLVILLKYPDGYESVLDVQQKDGCSSVEAENIVFGVDHTQIGKVLMNKWNMPESLMEGVRYHHAPRPSGKSDLLSYIVGYGNVLSHLYYAPKPGPQETEDPSTLPPVEENIVSLFLKPLEVSEAGHRMILGTFEEEFRNAELFG